MLEIILLYFLTKKIGAVAASKGLSAGRWKFNLILAWIVAELLGGIVGIMIFGKDNLFSALLIALASAVSTYFIISNYLTKLPDAIDDNDINNIGSGDQ